jgi:PhnB protein
VDAGAQLTRPVADRLHGDRKGGVTDPFGHRWFVAMHTEDDPADELERRARAPAPVAPDTGASI